MKVRTVTWRDSLMHIEQEPATREWRVATITSIGFVVEETENHIVLAGDTLDDDVRRVIVIPKENIIKVK